MHQTDTACAWLVCHSQEGLYKLYPTIPPLRRPGPQFFGGSQLCDPAAWLGERQLLRETLSPSKTKPTLKTLLHTLTKYTNSTVQPSHSSPPSLSPTHSPPNSHTSVQSPLPPLQHTHIPQCIYSTAHTYIPQATYWTSGCLPGVCCLCWPGGNDAWKGYLNLLGCRTPPQLHAVGVGRQQQQRGDDQQYSVGCKRL